MKNKTYPNIIRSISSEMGGDDLGTIWYRVRGGSIGEAIIYLILNMNRQDGYIVVDISIRKKYWLWGQIIIDVILENPEKIKELEGTQHYSKQWNENLGN